MRLLVLQDACANPQAVLSVGAGRRETVVVSATQPYGIDDLLSSIMLQLQKKMATMMVLVPYDRGVLVDEIYRAGVVVREAFTEVGTIMHCHVPLHLAGKLESMQIEDSALLDAAYDSMEMDVVDAGTGTGAGTATSDESDEDDGVDDEQWEAELAALEAEWEAEAEAEAEAAASAESEL